MILVVEKTIRDLIIIALSVIFLTFLIWLPHILALQNFWGLDFSNGFNTIYRNFDGLEYVVIAKTDYNPGLIAGIPQPLPATYFASHFPGFSVLIALFAPILGYLKSMLFVSGLFTIASAIAFFFLVRDFKLSSNPLFLSIVFLILPARWLIVHSVGSSEPLFIFLTIMTVYYFMKFEQSSKFIFVILAALFGLLTQITRPPGILIFLGLALFIHWQAFVKSKTIGWKIAFLDHLKYFPMIIMPLGLLGVFYFVGLKLGDFWAYFHSGDNIHLTLPPFQVFNKHQFWVGDIWLEDIIYIFILGFLGGITLWKKKLYSLAFIVLTYLTASTLIAHRDISRYILPITPFVLIAFEKVLVSKEFKIILPIIALAIYLYSQNFILENTAPIPNLNVYN